MTPRTPSALVLHAQDTVATSLRPLKAGEEVRVTQNGSVLSIPLLEDIAFGHKFALIDIPAEENVLKYGESIGRASTAIARGRHVHVHNLESDRARGDREAARP
ncbi:MAG: UxaA family hydrolase [Verrucomicrobiota bacterium]